MKVVHVCLNRHGGAANAAWRLHLTLLAKGVDSWFFTLVPRAKEDATQNWVCWKAQPKNIWQRAIKHMRSKTRKLKEFARWKELRSLQTKYNSIENSFRCEISSMPVAETDILAQPVFHNADIIHLHWVTLLINYPNFFKQCNRFRLFWTFHDLNPISGIFNYEFDLITNSGAAELNKAVVDFKKKCLEDYRGIIQVIAPCKWMAECAKASIFSDKINITEIPYCFEPTTVNIGSKKEARERLGLSSSATIFLSAVENNESGRKNIRQLTELIHSSPDSLFVVIGRNPDFLVGKQNVISQGYIEDKTLLYNYFVAADAILITSVEDNLPNVMLEAFAVGRPVISYPIGGMKQYVLEGITGIQAKDMEPVSFEQALTIFINTREIYHADTIQKFSRKHFNNEKIANAHIALYN